MSFDTIRVKHAKFNFVVACTFVDVFAGSLPLLWDLSEGLRRNLSKLFAAASLFFLLNIVRLEISQILYAHGLPWEVADQVLGGIAYFLVWLVIWSQRTWIVFAEDPKPVSPENRILVA